MGVYFAALEPGDTILSMRLDHGGHLSHGLKVNFSGRLYNIVGYGVDRETALIDFDEVRSLAKEHRPKLILCGGSAYPRAIDAERFREIADEVDALLMCDMAHFAGLVAAGLHEPDAALRLRHLDDAQDARGPARGLHPLPRGVREGRRPRRHSPACRAGPLEHTIAAKATCFRIAATEPFREYQQQVRANADALATTLMAGGLDLLTGGTDTHLLQVDLRKSDWTGKDAEERLHEVKLTVNRNTVPFDERPPTVGSGVRIGTPAATMRGFDESDFREVGHVIVEALGESPDIDALAIGSPSCARSGRCTRASAGSRRTHRERDRRRPRHARDAPARAAQAVVPARQGNADRPLPQARRGSDAAADVRGDEGLPDRGRRDRDAARARADSADRRQEGGGLPGARAAWECSTASSR